MKSGAFALEEPDNLPQDALVIERPVVLVGMPGAGKTSLGRALAKDIGAPFFDSDREIEAAANMSVLEILDRYGETHFRDGERRVILRLLQNGPCVLATGDGAWICDRTRIEVAAQAISVWLRATPELLWRRISGNPNRPLLHDDDPHGRLLSMLEERSSLYAQADIVIDSEKIARAVMVDRLIEALRTWLLDNPR